MAQVQANGITIEYEIAGPEHGPVLLMIHGVGAQLIRWPEGLCAKLVAEGFRILRFDNRDVGLSTHMTGAPVPDIAAAVQAVAEGRDPDLPYTLGDMAADAVGLLDALGIGPVHVLGVSLGGMVAQVMGIVHPERVLSLAIVMSQSGSPANPPSRPEAMAILSRPAPDPRQDREGYIRHQIELNRVLGSPDYPAPEAALRAIAGRAADRAWNPQGPARHLAASRAAPDRSAALRRLSHPALVIHGSDDPLIPEECGEDLARNFRHAWLLKVNGMGHDLPEELFDLFTGAIAANCARATA